MKHLGGAKIKNYQTLINKTKQEREQLTLEYRALQSKMDKLNSRIKGYQEELTKITSQSNSLIVSEHAMIRYLERVYKLDLFKIEAEIASAELFTKVQELGSGTYSCEDGYSAKVVDGVVVTILDNKLHTNRYTHTKKPKVQLKPKVTANREVQEYYEEVE